jgi:hypothetical protein
MSKAYPPPAPPGLSRAPPPMAPPMAQPGRGGPPMSQYGRPPQYGYGNPQGKFKAIV